MRKAGPWPPRKGPDGETEHERNKRLRGERERRLRKEFRHPRRDAEGDDLGGFRVRI